MWCAFDAVGTPRWRVIRDVGDRAEELLGQLGVEAGDRRRAEGPRRTRKAGGRRCRSRTRPATRPSGRACSRSGESRRGRRAPRRAPGRATMPTSSTVWCAPVSRSPWPRPSGRGARGGRAGRACGRGSRRRSRPETSPPSRSSSSETFGLARLARDCRGACHLSQVTCKSPSSWTTRPSLTRRARAAPRPSRSRRLPGQASPRARPKPPRPTCAA